MNPPQDSYIHIFFLNSHLLCKILITYNFINYKLTTLKIYNIDNIDNCNMSNLRGFKYKPLGWQHLT